jgi:hypothetical protein
MYLQKTNEPHKVRFAIVALTQSWAIVEYRNSGAYTYHKYASSMRDLCAYAKIVAGLNIMGVLQMRFTRLLSIRSGLKFRSKSLVNDDIGASFRFCAKN